MLALLLCYSINALGSGKTDEFSKKFGLIPAPQKVELLSGGGISYNTIQAVHLQGMAKMPVLYGELKGLPLSDKSAAGILTLNLSDNKNLPNSPEGYVLQIKNGQVTIHARSQAGLFYGCQTLLQLLTDAHDQQIKIPSCRITDYPDIAYRAVHLDLKHHLDHISYYYQMMDRLARVKINAVIVEFEDKLRYRNTPVIGASDAISVEQFAALSRYAHERNIEISPLVQGLGHASYILKHAQYKHLREDSTSDWAFSPLDSGTYKLLFSMYGEAMKATPYGKYLHVGGDEVGSLGTSALSKKSGMAPFELQMYWLDRVCEFAKRHHRIPIFWDDMVFKLAGLYKTTYDADMPEEKVNELWKENSKKLNENIQLFPKNCVYMRWNYSSPALPGDIKAINWYQSHHLNAMAATAAQTTWTMMPRNHSNFQPIKDFCRITADKNLKGILCTVWDDSSPHYETVWRGLYFFALFSWNDDDISLKDAESMFRHRFYGPALSDSSHEFQDSLEQELYFWETALLDKGSRKKTENIDLIALPDRKDGGTWSKKYAKKITDAQVTIDQYKVTGNRINAATQKARRNRYSLSLMNQLNNLQIYPAKLILLLKDYDQAKDPDKHEKLKQIVRYAKSFDSIRHQFEQVFSETRVLNKPDGYQLDQNHHRHWANTTLNSDWMYLIEMKMNNEIAKWAKENMIRDPSVKLLNKDL